MDIEPDHWAWKRIRPDHHAGAIRNYARYSQKIRHRLHQFTDIFSHELSDWTLELQCRSTCTVLARFHCLFREDKDALPRGPDMSPRQCDLCVSLVEYDSASPCGSDWFLSDTNDSDSSEDLGAPFVKNMRMKFNSSRFDMGGKCYMFVSCHGKLPYPYIGTCYQVARSICSRVSVTKVYPGLREIRSSHWHNT